MSGAKRVGVAGLGLVLAAGCLGGCATSPKQPPYTGHMDQVDPRAYPQVAIAGELANYIALGRPTVEKTDVLTVVAPIRLLSKPGYESNIQYRFLFLKKDGTPARGGDMNWRFMHMAPLNQVFLTGNSLDADADDWRCEVRLAR